MQENLTKLEKIDSLRYNGMVNMERIEILLELLLHYIDGEKGISPVLEIILEKAKETAKIFEEIEMNC